MFTKIYPDLSHSPAGCSRHYGLLRSSRQGNLSSPTNLPASSIRYEISVVKAMPLLGHRNPDAPLPVYHDTQQEKSQAQPRIIPARRQSQHSVIAKTAIMSKFTIPPNLDGESTSEERGTASSDKPLTVKPSETNLAAPQPAHSASSGACLTDTPLTTAQNSPRASPRM